MTLDELIESFMSHKQPHVPFKRKGYFVHQLADPTIATDRCSSASDAFFTHLRTAWRDQLDADGYLPGVTILHVNWFYEEDHACNLVNGIVVDWTARQFDPDVAFPLVEPLAEYLQRCEPYFVDFYAPHVAFDPSFPYRRVA